MDEASGIWRDEGRGDEDGDGDEGDLDGEVGGLMWAWVSAEFRRAHRAGESPAGPLAVARLANPTTPATSETGS